MFDDPQWIAFQKQLDERPDSHETRSVLADWLEGFGNPWARAYRWMARYKRWPFIHESLMGGWYYDGFLMNGADSQKHSRLFGVFSGFKKLMDIDDRFDAEITLCKMYDLLPLRGKEHV